MNEFIDIKSLEEILVKKDGSIKHEVGKKRLMFPFNTTIKKGYFKKSGFRGVLGQFSRNLLGKELKEGFSHIEIVENVAVKIANDPTDTEEFSHFLNEYLFGGGDSGNFNAFHPHIFCYFPLTDGPEKNFEERIAQFLSEVIVPPQSKNQIQQFFANLETNDLLAELVINELDELENKKVRSSYACKIEFLPHLFLKDFLYLAKFEDYFSDNYHLLLNHYYFVYVSQLAIKLDLYEKASYDQLTPVYYLLEWEKSNKRRKAHTQGWKWMMDKADKVMHHVHALSQLSHSALAQKEEDILTYKEIYLLLSEKDEAEQKQYIKEANAWIERYCELAKIDQPEVRANDLPQVFRNLTSCLRRKIPKEAANRYKSGIELAAEHYFIRSRGRLGKTLNVTQQFLMLMAAVAVRDERIPLKHFFYRLEQRGLFFDRDSQSEVVNLLNKLNLLDKKSDSGDAQYVKPIL